MGKIPSMMLAALLGTVGCYPELDTENRACGEGSSCPSGYLCVEDRCVPSSETQDLGPADQGPAATDAGVDAFVGDGGIGDGGCTLELADEPPSPLIRPSRRLAVGQLNGACLVRSGKLFCWGATNDDGRLNGVPSACPSEGCLFEVDHPDGGEWAKVAVGAKHVCAIDTSNRLYCWGSNEQGQLGDPDATGGVERVAAYAVDEVTASGTGTCAIKGDTRTVNCWGYDVSGQTGVQVSGMCQAMETVPEPTRIAENAIDACPPTSTEPERSRWVVLSASTETVCGQLVDGRAFCWGGLVQGLTGRDHVVCQKGCVPEQLGDGTWIQLAEATFFHRCGIDDRGELLCWGRNGHGQLGLGYVSEDATPDYGACTVEPDGVPIDAYDNDRGNEVLLNETAPVAHPTGGEWVRVGAGYIHTCALDDADQVWCWGSNWEDAIDDTRPSGFDDLILEPYRIPLPTERGSIVELAVGRRLTCVLTDAEEVICWGEYPDRCAGAVSCEEIHQVPLPSP